MKLISKIETGKQTINLFDSYKIINEKRPLWVEDNFYQILKEATSDSEVVEIDEIFYKYEQRWSSQHIPNEKVMKKMKEKPIDLGNAAGRLEARKRLGALAFFLQKQPVGTKGVLEITGHSNTIGWIKTSSGSVFCTGAYQSTFNNWSCSASLPHINLCGPGFWSRNSEI